MTFAGPVEPDPHHPVRRRIVEHVVRRSPSVSGSLRLRWRRTNRLATRESDHQDDDEDADHHTHPVVQASSWATTTAVPYTTISVRDCPISEESNRIDTMALAPVS